MNKNKHINNEQGFVLVASLLILMILVIIGIAATTTTTIELQIAANERIHKETFYGAEGSSELTVSVLDQNLNCPTGFTSTGTDDDGVTVVADLENVIRVYERNGNDLAIYQNAIHASADIGDLTKMDLSFTYPADAAVNLDDLDNAGRQQTAYVYLGGGTEMAAGGSLQMAAGYEGKGKSAAGGGVVKLYDIVTQYQGKSNSESIVELGWRYPVGWAGSCNY